MVLVEFAVGAADLNGFTAKLAAKNFIEKDGVGSSLLIGCSVKDVTARGGLWVVTLKPSGYILLSGNTAAEPVVAFSRNDFVEPEEGTAFAKMIECAQANAAVAKANAAAVESVNSGVMSVSLASVADEGESSRRAAKWDLLLGTSTVKSLLSGGISLASVTSDESLTKSVLPFLETEWTQDQPYNDYVPIEEGLSAECAARGRYACGCVATAYAQVMKYWEWPVRMDEVFVCDHEIRDVSTGMNAEKLCRVRFDGHAAFDWGAMANEYDWYRYTNSWAYTCDMRGTTAEKARYEVARLVSMSAVMAEMYYWVGGSGANVVTVARKNPWYEAGSVLVRSTVGDDKFFAAVKASLEEAVPVLVTVPGHQVIAHGWAEGTDGTGYVYLNYGWSYNDGYFNITETDAETTSKGYIDTAVVGHRPRKMVQMEDLAAVSEEDVTLKWQVPERCAADFSGYEVYVGKMGMEVTNWGYDFEDTSVDYGGLTATTISGIGNDTGVVTILPGKSARYEFPMDVVLTGHSMLSYKFRCEAAVGLGLKVQAQFDGGGWEDVDAPTITGSETPSWSVRKVFLGERAGAALRLRVVVETDGHYLLEPEASDGLQLDDFAVTDVVGFEESVVTCGARAREYVAKGLEAGAKYSFRVKPVGEGTEKSAAVQTTIEGAGKVPRAGGYAVGDYVFTAGDENWSVATSDGNEASEGSILLGQTSGTLSVVATGDLTKDSVFSFDWTATGYYSSTAYDVLTVVFKPVTSEAVTLWTKTNTAKQTMAQQVEISLGEYAGERGEVGINFRCVRSPYKNTGATISNAKLTNVMGPDLDGEIEWMSVERSAGKVPRIRSVTSVSEDSVAVQEGFYRECARGGNVFFVNCSAGVTNLVAQASHQYLLTEENVTVESLGRGKFAVTVDGSGIAEADDRTRMILTLEAEDEDGRKAYKDLSLRFSSETEGESYVASAADFVTTTVIPVPYTWLEEKGLAKIDETMGAEELAKVMNAAAAADSDGDGFANYAEYLCGAEPKDKEDYLKASIEMVNGKPVISWNVMSEEAEYTVIGAEKLDAGNWKAVDDSNISKMRFFRVNATMKYGGVF